MLETQKNRSVTICYTVCNCSSCKGTFAGFSPMTEGSAAFERSFLSLLLGPVPRRMPIMVSCNASGSSSDGVSGNESEDDFDYVYELDKQNEDKGLHAPVGSRAGRCELVRYFPIFWWF